VKPVATIGRASRRFTSATIRLAGTASERFTHEQETRAPCPANNVIVDLTGNVYDEDGDWLGMLTGRGSR
jgi:hypothetical protein